MLDTPSQIIFLFAGTRTLSAKRCIMGIVIWQRDILFKNNVRDRICDKWRYT